MEQQKTNGAPVETGNLPLDRVSSASLAPSSPKRIKLARRTAVALRDNIETANQADREARAAREKANQLAAVNQKYYAALILDAGGRMEDFASFHLVEEDNGIVYLEALPR